MISRMAVTLILACTLGCSSQTATRTLPDGYKVWVMNSEEVYVSNADNELLVGPLLKQIGVTHRHIVTTSKVAGPSYIGNLRTSGFSLIERSTGNLTTGMTKADAARKLSATGESMPELVDFKAYELIKQ